MYYKLSDPRFGTDCLEEWSYRKEATTVEQSCYTVKKTYRFRYNLSGRHHILGFEIKPFKVKASQNNPTLPNNVHYRVRLRLTVGTETWTASRNVYASSFNTLVGPFGGPNVLWGLPFGAWNCENVNRFLDVEILAEDPAACNSSCSSYADVENLECTIYHRAPEAFLAFNQSGTFTGGSASLRGINGGLAESNIGANNAFSLNLSGYDFSIVPSDAILVGHQLTLDAQITGGSTSVDVDTSVGYTVGYTASQFFTVVANGQWQRFTLGSELDRWGWDLLYTPTGIKTPLLTGAVASNVYTVLAGTNPTGQTLRFRNVSLQLFWVPKCGYLGTGYNDNGIPVPCPGYASGSNEGPGTGSGSGSGSGSSGCPPGTVYNPRTGICEATFEPPP